MKTLPTLALTMVATLLVDAQETNPPVVRDRLSRVIVRSPGQPTNPVTGYPPNLAIPINTPSTNASPASETTSTNQFSQRLVSEFIGTLVAVDKEKRTVSIASGAPAKADPAKASELVLTPETKIFKGDAAGTLEDAVVGGEVRYGLRLGRDGAKSQLTTLRILPASTVSPR